MPQSNPCSVAFVSRLSFPETVLAASPTSATNVSRCRIRSSISTYWDMISSASVLLLLCRVPRRWWRSVVWAVMKGFICADIREEGESKCGLYGLLTSHQVNPNSPTYGFECTAAWPLFRAMASARSLSTRASTMRVSRSFKLPMTLRSSKSASNSLCAQQ